MADVFNERLPPAGTSVVDDDEKDGPTTGYSWLVCALISAYVAGYVTHDAAMVKQKLI